MKRPWVRSFKFKLSWALAGCFVLVVVLHTFVTLYTNRQFLDRVLKQKLHAIAVGTAAFIDVETHEMLRKPGDMRRPEYQRLIAKLHGILETEPALKFIYTLRPDQQRSDGAQKTFRFVLDGGSAGTPLDASSAYFSKIGDPYDKLPPVALRVFQTGKPAVDKQPVKDQWGWTISGYAPLLDAAGKVVAILGVDMTLDEWNEYQTRMLRQGAIAGVAAAMLAFLLGTLISRSVLRPVDELYQGTLRVARGNFGQRIPVGRRDEFGVMMTTFNVMQKHLEQSFTAIEQRAVLKAQLDLASTVQSHLARFAALADARVRTHAYTRAAGETGGDWAHYHIAASRYFYAAVGDVAGHGPAPALVAAAVAGAFEGLKPQLELDAERVTAAAVLRYADKIVAAAGRREFPMTMVVIRIDLETGEMLHASAGHPPARLVRRDGEVTSLINTSDPLGLDSPRGYVDSCVQLQPGELVALYSDGLIDLRNAQGKIYGLRRLSKALRRLSRQSLDPKWVATELLREVGEFAPQHELDDDLSLVVVSYAGRVSGDSSSTAA